MALPPPPFLPRRPHTRNTRSTRCSCCSRPAPTRTRASLRRSRRRCTLPRNPRQSTRNSSRACPPAERRPRATHPDARTLHSLALSGEEGSAGNANGAAASPSAISCCATHSSTPRDRARARARAADRSNSRGLETQLSAWLRGAEARVERKRRRRCCGRAADLLGAAAHRARWRRAPARTRAPFIIAARIRARPPRTRGGYRCPCDNFHANDKVSNPGYLPKRTRARSRRSRASRGSRRRRAAAARELRRPTAPSLPSQPRSTPPLPQQPPQLAITAIATSRRQPPNSRQHSFRQRPSCRSRAAPRHATGAHMPRAAAAPPHCRACDRRARVRPRRPVDWFV